MRTVIVSEMQELARAVRVRPPPRVALALPGLDPEEAGEWERRINRDLHACGCDAGSTALLAAFGVSTSAVLLGWPLELSSGLSMAVVGSTTLVAALLGKVLGRLHAHRRAQREAARLKARLAELSSSSLRGRSS